ncbi:hypothetical protein [Ferrimicrobium sp.]|nr:hypothetical protein [Ferrimicrobium sp.]
MMTSEAIAHGHASLTGGFASGQNLSCAPVTAVRDAMGYALGPPH